MQISNDGLCELAAREGIVLSPYLDSVGVKTVGLGSTVSDIPDLPSWPWNKTITVKEAVDYYKKGLAKYEAAVNKAVKVPIMQYQYDALVSICYNIGVGGLSGSTFIKCINAKASLDSIGQAIMMWNKPSVIIKRRQKEVALYKTGKYSNALVSVGVADPVTHKEKLTGKTINLKDYL